MPHVKAAPRTTPGSARASATARIASGRSSSTAVPAAGASPRSPAPRASPADRFLRTLGFRRAALREEDELERPDARARSTPTPPASTRRPPTGRSRSSSSSCASPFEPWRPADTLTPDQAARPRPLDQLGARAAAGRPGARARPRADGDPRPRLPGRQPGRADPRRPWDGDGAAAAERVGELRAALGFASEATGSNNWAVSGERSATGGPLLAGDPHLSPSMPGITYGLGLERRRPVLPRRVVSRPARDRVRARTTTSPGH